MQKSQKSAQRGHKRRYAREAVESLGLDASYPDASTWIKKKYGAEIGEPTFYVVRKEMQQQAGMRPRPGAGAAEVPAQGGEPTPTGAAAPEPQTPPAGATTEKAGGNGRSQGEAGGDRPAVEQPTPASAAAPQAAPPSAAPSPQDGVAALVLQAKGLVERLGKEEAKKLIDAL